MRSIMVKKMIIVLIILFGTSLYFGVFDFFNLRKNKVLILNKVENLDITIFFVSGQDSLLVFNNNKQLLHYLPNWYGQDHLLVKKNRLEFKHHPVRFKMEHWKKIHYSLKISKLEEKLVLDWNLKTLWESNSGIDTILITEPLIQ